MSLCLVTIVIIYVVKLIVLYVMCIHCVLNLLPTVLIFHRNLLSNFLTKRCNCITVSSYCHDMLSVSACDTSVL